MTKALKILISTRSWKIREGRLLKLTGRTCAGVNRCKIDSFSWLRVIEGSFRGVFVLKCLYLCYNYKEKIFIFNP